MVIKCQDCEKTPSKTLCGRCREVLKVDMALIFRDMDRIYLTESTRNNAGRPTTPPTNIEEILSTYAKVHSYRKTATLCNTSKYYVSQLVKSHKHSSK